MVKELSRWWKLRLALLGLLVGLTRLGLAHTAGLSTGDLKFGTNGLEAQLTFAIVDVLPALAQLETLKPLDADHDGQVTQTELTANLEQLRVFAAEALAVEFDGQRIGGSIPQLTVDDKDNFLIQLNFPGKRPAQFRVQAMLFSHLPENHSQFLSVQDQSGAILGNRMLIANDNTLELTLVTSPTQPETKPKQTQGSTFGGFFVLGVEHIWTGYDHLLFLLALLLVCSTFKSAFQVVTFFTLAHSMTLALATLNLVWMSGRVVEPVIAASIIYVAVENFFRPHGDKGRWLITFSFGLIHGFGFASVLRDLGVATSATGVTMPLVAFNLGVEAGQIVIAGVLLPIIWKCRKSERFVRLGVPGISVVVAGAGGYWLIQRLFFS